jgi:hypothetical protein
MAIATVTLAISPLGCSPKDFYPVRGKVMYQGKPAAGASVHFRREGETPEQAVNFPIGIVDQDGNFTLEVAGVGSGAPTGKYKVLVRWESSKDLSTPAPPKNSRNPRGSVSDVRRDPRSDSDRLKFRYFNLEKPLLFAEVKTGDNQLDPFELKD